MYGVYLFDIPFTWFLLTQILMINKYLLNFDCGNSLSYSLTFCFRFVVCFTKHRNFRDLRKSRKTYFIYEMGESFAIFGIYVRILILKRPLLFNFTRGKFRDAHESVTNL